MEVGGLHPPELHPPELELHPPGEEEGGHTDKGRRSVGQPQK